MSETDDKTLLGRFSKLEVVATVAILLAGLGLTAIVFKIVTDTHRQGTESGFEQQATDAASALSNTLIRHTNLLLALQGLFHASENVSRLEFNAFIQSIDAKNNFPEAAAISWNSIVPADRLDTFEQSVRLDTSLDPNGYADFSVHPVVKNEAAIVVNYTEPMRGNERAFGFNIASNPNRLAAVEQSRDSGEVVITSPITLAQETGNQRAFLMMMPIYHPMNPLTLEQRRSAFDGLVIAVFRGGDLIRRSAKADFSFFRVQDVTNPKIPLEDQLLHSSGQPLADEHFLKSYRTIEIGNRSWLLTFEQSLADVKFGNRAIETVVASLGVLASLLSAMLFGSLASSRRKAQLQARKLTIDLQTANDELMRSNADLSQFAHVASHDLQTPVRNVISAVTLLEDRLGNNSDSEVHEYLGFLNTSAIRMRTLVTDLLNYARLGRDAISFDEVDLNDIMLDVVESTQEQIEESGCRFQSDTLPTVSGDARQLQRVFENLILNAIKYAHPDRTPEIQISVNHRTGKQRNSATDSDNNEHVQLLFSDNGQGIQADFHEAVFLPFRRLHRHDDIPGTGLGLGICKQILERHGGSITIETSSDKGTAFLVSMPRIKHRGTTI